LDEGGTRRDRKITQNVVGVLEADRRRVRALRRAAEDADPRRRRHRRGALPSQAHLSAHPHLFQIVHPEARPRSASRQVQRERFGYRSPSQRQSSRQPCRKWQRREAEIIGRIGSRFSSTADHAAEDHGAGLAKPRNGSTGVRDADVVG